MPCPWACRIYATRSVQIALLTLLPVVSARVLWAGTTWDVCRVQQQHCRLTQLRVELGPVRKTIRCWTSAASYARPRSAASRCLPSCPSWIHGLLPIYINQSHLHHVNRHGNGRHMALGTIKPYCRSPTGSGLHTHCAASPIQFDSHI